MTISGHVDAANIDRVGEFVTRSVLIGNAVVLDLAQVPFFAAQSVSVLFDLDHLCGAAELAWMMVPSAAVRRVLRFIDGDTTELSANSVPEALRRVADLSRARRSLAHAPKV